MDPGSVAGIALATVSLTIQLADGARKGFVVLEDAVYADETCRSFAVRLAIEHADFETWMEDCGLNEAVKAQNGIVSADTQTFESFLQYRGPVIAQILAEIHLLMIQLTKSENRYSSLLNDDAETSVHVVQSGGADITEPLPLKSNAIAQVLRVRNVRAPRFVQNSNHPRQQDVEPSDSRKATPFDIIKRLTKATKTALEPKRLRWVIKDKKSCGEKILRLSNLNQSLLRSLNRAEAQGNATLFQMMLLQMSDTHSLVQELFTATQLDKSTASGVSGTILSGTTMVSASADVATTEKKDFIREASIFALAALEALSTEARPVGIPDLVYDKSMIDKYRVSAKVTNNESAWIEWKSYDEVLVGESWDINPKTIKGMDRLVTLLQIPAKPQAFCVPPCLGYFVDDKNTRIGIVYQAPVGAAVQIPHSLQDSFNSPAASLSGRVRIAQDLAQWLLHFHTVRWYHKGFRSSNVLFFTLDNLIESERAYITGFEYARTAGEGPKTTKPPTGVDDNDYYVHPNYLGDRRGEGYLQIYDIYSLGIVLVELAYWRPIHQIFQGIAAANGDSPASSPDTVRAQVIKHTPKVLEGMRSRVGDRYMAAATACLNGMEAWRSDDVSHGSTGEANAALLYDFNDAVIRVLQDIDM